MIAHHEMDLVGKAQLVPDRLEEQLVGQASAGAILRAAVDDLLQNDMPVRVVGQLGVGDEAFEVAAVAMDVAADDQRALGRQTDEVGASESVGLIGSNSLIEQVDGCLRHFGSL